MNFNQPLCQSHVKYQNFHLKKKTFEFSSQIKFGMNEFIKFGMSDISIQPNRIGSRARYKIIKLYFYQHKLCNLFRARR